MEFKYRAIDNVNPSTPPRSLPTVTYIPDRSIPMDGDFTGFRVPMAAGDAALRRELEKEPISLFPNPNSKSIHHYSQQQQAFPLCSPNPFTSPSRASANQAVGGGYPLPRPPLLYSHGSGVPAMNLDYLSPAMHVTRPLSHLQFPHLTATTPPPAKGHLKRTGRSTVSDVNDYKDASEREKSIEDAFTVVEGRKVRITEDASLYALCRSWLRNGVNDESQPLQKNVTMMPLPKPSPASKVNTCTSSNNKKDGENDEDEQEENEKSIEHLSAQDILKRHIKRAKMVRARLREERLQRIARYRRRLMLLVPPPA